MMRASAGFLAAFGSGDRARLAEFYRADAVLWTPLASPLRGREAIGGYFSDLHSAFPGLRVSLRDEFGSPDGSRACIRVHLDWQNTGSFRGHPPVGRSGEMTETHSFRLADGMVAEQVAGVSSFQISGLFLADWGMGFPREAGNRPLRSAPRRLGMRRPAPTGRWRGGLWMRSAAATPPPWPRSTPRMWCCIRRWLGRRGGARH